MGLGLLRVVAQPVDVFPDASLEVILGLLAGVGTNAGDIHGWVAVDTGSRQG